jgi:hypothetical protein
MVATRVIEISEKRLLNPFPIFKENPMKQSVVQDIRRGVKSSIMIVLVAVTCLLSMGNLTIMTPAPTNNYHKNQAVLCGGYGTGEADEKAYFQDQVPNPGQPPTYSYVTEGFGDVSNFDMGGMAMWEAYLWPDDENSGTSPDYWSVSTTGIMGTYPDHYAAVDDMEGSGDIIGAHVITNTLEP